MTQACRNPSGEGPCVPEWGVAVGEVGPEILGDEWEWFRMAQFDCGWGFHGLRYSLLEWLGLSQL